MVFTRPKFINTIVLNYSINLYDNLIGDDDEDTTKGFYFL